MDFFSQFQHLKVRLEDIKLATNNFSDYNLIGKGGFGKVYKGEISFTKGHSMAAIKRLDRTLGQGNLEFWKEIMILSGYTHENLVSLLGFCDDGGEKILVYEYASRGSLDHHLSSTTLTWTQRLKICLGVARGLSYLHDPNETQERVIHRDIKSSNILLDENWNAKVSDFGLSKIGHANQLHSVIVSNLAGTPVYCDPLYMETGLLTKESDIYSFGVILFEVLCGRLCFERRNEQFKNLVPMWKRSYEEKKLAEIIFHDLKQQTDLIYLETFSDIAYQCLERSREKRPPMAHIVEKLEIALEPPKEYEEIVKSEVPALSNRHKVELRSLLSKGILVNQGKTWFSLNNNKEHCEMISASECLFPLSRFQRRSAVISRFPGGSYLASKRIFEAHVRTQFLSPHITYTVNIVFKFTSMKKNLRKRTFLNLQYRLKGEEKHSIYLADRREDGWYMAELYQFTSDRPTFDLEIHFEGARYKNSLIVEGIEFRPLKKVKHEASEDKKLDMQPISHSDIDWEQKLPNDYEQIIKWSKDIMEWTTKKDLYFIFCKGFLINSGEKWFSIAKKGKKCCMLSARAALVESDWTWQSLPASRFEEVAYDPIMNFSIICEIESYILSPQTTYACYLVYNITKNHSAFKAPVEVTKKMAHFSSIYSHFWFIYLLSPQTPVIRPKIDQKTHTPLDIPKIKGLPQLRNDGWMEVQVWEFQTCDTCEIFSMEFQLRKIIDNPLGGLIVQGIEFRPL